VEAIQGKYTVEFGSRLLVPRFMLEKFNSINFAHIDLAAETADETEKFVPVAEIPIDFADLRTEIEMNQFHSHTNPITTAPTQRVEHLPPLAADQQTSRKKRSRKKQRIYSRSELTTLVSPYRRLLARSIDLFWEIFFVLALAHFLLQSFDASLLQIFQTPLATALLAILLMPVSMLLDALFYAAIGNTPGKAIFGLRVVSRKLKTIGFGRYFSRNLRLWHRALACGLVPLTFFYMAREGIRATRGTETLYDQKEGTRVSQPIVPSVAQPIVGFVLLTAALAVTASLAVQTF